MRMWGACLAAAVWLSTTAATGEPHDLSDAELRAYAAPERLVTLPDGRKLNFVCRGKGAPTVVIEPGFASWSLEGRLVLAETSRTNLTCSYDRAGLGFSSPATGPRSPYHIAQDLRDGLREAAIPGPYVLVGHSKGATYIRAFQHAYPEVVVGMVFADPGGPESNRAMAEVDPQAAAANAWIIETLSTCVTLSRDGGLARGIREPALCVAEPEPTWPEQLKLAHQRLQVSPAHAQAVLAEMEAPQPLPKLTRGSLGELPIVVLTAERGLSPDIPPDAREKLERVWVEFAEALAAQSSRGSHRVIKDAPHWLLTAEPRAVNDAIQEVVRASGPGAHPLPTTAGEGARRQAP